MGLKNVTRSASDLSLIDGLGISTKAGVELEPTVIYDPELGEKDPDWLS